nr:hypothetical protein StreXyl84_50690 [Streptomyces sp. Xyl84]
MPPPHPVTLGLCIITHRQLAGWQWILAGQGAGGSGRAAGERKAPPEPVEFLCGAAPAEARADGKRNADPGVPRTGSGGDFPAPRSPSPFFPPAFRRAFPGRVPGVGELRSNGRGRGTEALAGVPEFGVSRRGDLVMQT